MATATFKPPVTIAAAAGARQALGWLMRRLGRGGAAQAAVAGRHEHALAQGQTLEVADALGQMVVCQEGCLWITYDHTPQDHIVQVGQRHLAGSGSRMLVHAMSDARLAVCPIHAA